VVVAAQRSLSGTVESRATRCGRNQASLPVSSNPPTSPAIEAVRELMPTYFQLLEEEKAPAVRVVLGHFIFVYMHPYFDGNGRMGRFLMNLMMASGGYPWT
jgi:Fic family protein